MSIVTVQLGQCGNQIGFEVFDALFRDSHCSQGLCSKRENEAYQASCKERFFREEENGVPVARAVLVDMEPKVINQTLAKAAQSGQWKYGQHACFCQKQGSGNNWAYGYSVHGPKHEESVMNLIQKEVEKCDSLSGLFIMMSMAGGTGSGLGAFITQKLQDQYSSSLKMNQIIWPYGTGEVIVQNYNSVLTLSRLYRSSDALLIHENDAVHKICATRMNIKQISFRDLNRVLAHQLGSVLQPTYSEDGSSHYRRSPLGDLVEHLVPHPEFKMLGVRNIPQMSANSLAFSTFTWAGLLKHLRQMLISSAKMEEGIDWQVRPPLSGLPPLGKMSVHKELNFNTSIANLVILRGKEVQSADVEGFKDPALYTPWLGPAHAFSVWRTQRAFDKYEKSAALVSNSQLLVRPLDTIVGKAWNMFASKAYIHQYTRFGMEEEDFLDSFTLLEQVVASYSNL
ncbi:tubulin delta chain [Meriones unguiculatus]|uniref:tubulin delta chain n=1 Tax=Meriones unguiculatus TaxID=10047 RepID=UPI000B4E8ED5|nr:tubulin delta chain [Meriones unguiculatus]XP_021501516.1 tubulin delta chain [Meriones unguiculatus]XP_060243046.1 tubulin delta chain [Meriones unguiculatus]XP_060243047.1 tubulin delta chain [Meriones unguiculatus]XP_060243048.1 tubulin delta chain [Meriones unguiculatus]XP_060243049.1 tubulin delta chain [Meriones unguiculatus]XP_060243050.1 tubulin delta chain [Meriones unguiculatus]